MIPIIKKESLCHLKNILIIITTGTPGIDRTIKAELEEHPGTTVIHVNDLIGRFENITGREIKEMGKDGCYEDLWGNRIRFDETISDGISVVFYGNNNTLEVGSNVVADNLTIRFGNEGKCIIGENTGIVGGYFAVSEAGVMIGRDCLLSADVLIQNNDGHHIFDARMHKRINYAKDIVIGDHVWIGFRAVILSGAEIGMGSIVGANAVTSGQFGEHQIIAGCPAKVIRENVCWSKDNTDYFNRNALEECISLEALKYL